MLRVGGGGGTEWRGRSDFGGTCDPGMSASTTDIYCSGLAGFGDDFFNNKYYLQILKNTNSVGNAPELQVRKITDYVSDTGKFVTDAFGATVEAGDEIAVLHESIVAIGRDDSNNVFSSSNVASNPAGSLFERIQWVQETLGGAAGQMRWQASISTTVEENSMQQFGIAIFDVDAGAIASADIDITGISSVMEKSTGGGAFSSVGITQPTFSKDDGRVYCGYQFLAAEWQIGDMYRLTVTGITATIGGDTAYVPAVVWSNLIIEALSLKTNVDAIKAVTDLLPDGGALTSIAQEATLASHDIDVKALIGTPVADLATDVADVDSDVAAAKAVIDNIILDTQIRTISAGSKTIAAGATKYLSFDSGTNGAEIISILIKGIIGAAWTLDVYIPTDDAVGSPAAGDKRDTITYLSTDTEGGLLQGFGIIFNGFLDFTNGGGGNQTIDDVMIIYRSRGVLTVGWET